MRLEHSSTCPSFGAQRLWHASPKRMVGVVLVKGGKIIGCGWHRHALPTSFEIFPQPVNQVSHNGRQ